MPNPYLPPKFTGANQSLVGKLNTVAKAATRAGLTPGQFQSSTQISGFSSPGGGTTTTSSLELAYAMAVDTIPAFTAISGTEFTCTPGYLDQSDEPTPSGVVMLEWEGSGVTDAAKIGRELVPIMVGPEDEPTNQYPLRRACINVSGTDIRGSEGEPIVLIGFSETITVDDPEGGLMDETRFVASSIMDFRALPNYIKTPGDIQIPFHEDGARDFKLDQENCDVEA